MLHYVTILLYFRINILTQIKVLIYFATGTFGQVGQQNTAEKPIPLVTLMKNNTNYPCTKKEMISYSLFCL